MIFFLTPEQRKKMCVQRAEVVKLVDAEDSKSSERKFVPVRVRPSVPFFLIGGYKLIKLLELIYRFELRLRFGGL